MSKQRRMNKKLWQKKRKYKEAPTPVGGFGNIFAFTHRGIRLIEKQQKKKKKVIKTLTKTLTKKRGKQNVRFTYRNS